MIGTEVFAFFHPRDLKRDKGHVDQYKNVEFSSIYHHTMSEPNRLINVRMHVTVKGFVVVVVDVVFVCFVDAVSERAVVSFD